MKSGSGFQSESGAPVVSSRGDWAPSTQYYKGEMFVYSASVWVVNTTFFSGSVFDSTNCQLLVDLNRYTVGSSGGLATFQSSVLTPSGGNKTYVQDIAPNVSPGIPYLWIQTHAGPGGTDVSFWIEDGT